MSVDLDRMRKAAVCIHIAAEKEAADDVSAIMNEAANELELARPIVNAALKVVDADTYKHPILSREDAVAAGVSELHDAVGKWHSAQPASQEPTSR